MYEGPRFLPAGDQAIVVEFGDSISPGVNRRVHDMTLAIEKVRVQGVYDLCADVSFATGLLQPDEDVHVGAGSKPQTNS